ncbi:translesion DNA synthesis-associated protein ImuA [Oleiagrimonas sp. C23AA]|uniref:translesion DNA synthesis-associated protein ImuA n=1 Tax=Oleiagrimonas sp. C23AA TaxID=2719047 RepID=UPI001420CF56|nr:translesion DNA synthesis-associated protein ImuA [Oleiagrimonas sp. C23AA]NII09404.1 translesion DNA synthesis-associated protein ImuA [Oleiagrimonas sp. C23AA]
MSHALADVLHHPAAWRQATSGMAHVRTRSTGRAELDAQLPGGGWPQGALSEMLSEHDGLGDFNLALPALKALTREGRRVVLINPPYVPYAPALRAAGVDLRQLNQLAAEGPEAVWTMEQCLRSGGCGAVIAWIGQLDYRSLRRLQLAAESGDSLALLFRPAAEAAHNSPAGLRLHVCAEHGHTRVDVLKSRGRFQHHAVTPLPRGHLLSN